jgi:hypothetical protein
MIEPIFLITGTLGGVFAVVTTILSLLKYHKPRRITLSSAFLSGLIALLALAVMIFLGGLRIQPVLGLPLIILGLLLGFLRGQAVSLTFADKIVIGRNSPLVLFLWGISLAVSIFLGLLGSPLLASLGLIPVVFSTGLQLGYYGNLFLRRLFMRPDSVNKLINAIIGIAGTVFLLMMTAGVLALTIPDLLRTFPEPNWVAQAADYPSSSSTAADPTVSSEPAGIPAGTPSAAPETRQAEGPFQIDCAEQEEVIKQYALGAYNLFGTNYTFEEAFTDYSLSLEMTLDPAADEFTMTSIEQQGWRWQEYDPELDPPEAVTVINYLFEINGRGTIHDDGWISGDFDFSFQSWDYVSEQEIEQDQNQFYGYINDQQSQVTVCMLPFWVNRYESEQTADLAELRTSGKDQLISSWWSEKSCYTCNVE